MDEMNILRNAIVSFLKPIIVQVMTEALTEAFIAKEKQRETRYYTREEACNRLRIGTTTFYRLANKGKLTILKVEGKTLVNADEIDQAIETRTIYRYKR